jgi:hypothetical protein
VPFYVIIILKNKSLNLMNVFSADVLETIFKYSGLTGVIFLFLYLIFKSSIEKQFFPSLSQKRKVFIITISLFSIWSVGILVIMLSFVKSSPQNGNPQSTGFIYCGQIVNEDGIPIPNAIGYIALGNDTIRAETPTGLDGTFVIRLDTTEGVKATIHFSHPDYGSDSRFRPLIQSVPEQFILKKPRSVTFSTNLSDTLLAGAIHKRTGWKHVPFSSDYTIDFRYDASRLDSFDGRYRYLGGKAQVYINGKLCCQSMKPIPATWAAGNNKPDMERALNNSLRNIVNTEKDQLTQNIAKCTGASAQ